MAKAKSMPLPTSDVSSGWRCSCDGPTSLPSRAVEATPGPPTCQEDEGYHREERGIIPAETPRRVNEAYGPLPALREGIRHGRRHRPIERQLLLDGFPPTLIPSPSTRTGGR